MIPLQTSQSQHQISLFSKFDVVINKDATTILINFWLPALLISSIILFSIGYFIKKLKTKKLA